ncbi:MAG TPA: 4-hydroxythreonine-4-phosphate dehydrogenase PdxA [Cyclobacteriaceae bacterium]
MSATSRPHERPRIGITIGDINGVGPEVIMKALADARMLGILTPVIYGNGRVLSHYKKLLGLQEFSYNQVKDGGTFAVKNINVVNCWDQPIEISPGRPSPETGNAALKAIRRACDDLKSGVIDALVTGPIDKKTVSNEDFPFAGHTDFIAQFFGAGDSLMLMVSDTLRVGLVTVHVPVSEVAPLITRERLQAKIALLEQSLIKDFGVTKPKIAVLGLNPHAGDGGLIGKEEEEIIRPVVIELKNKGKLVQGPFPADGFFGSGSARKFDGILAMYHDQGLIPFKVISFDTGVNFTAGLPIVRTSPDHGTAFSIAGKNQADETSLRQAIFLAVDVLTRRNGSS